MVNLWFTQKDLRYRWSDVKKEVWEDLESYLRLSAKRLLGESLKVEQQHLVGAGHYQRTSKRRDYRNGYYTRQVIWKLGVLSDVLVPRNRSGVYQSAILERYKRFGGSFDRHILKLFTLGLATRRVERFITDFFGEYGIGAQTVSDILKRVSIVTVVVRLSASSRLSTMCILLQRNIHHGRLHKNTYTPHRLPNMSLSNTPTSSIWRKTDLTRHMAITTADDHP